MQSKTIQAARMFFLKEPSYDLETKIELTNTHNYDNINTYE